MYPNFQRVPFDSVSALRVRSETRSVKPNVLRSVGDAKYCLLFVLSFFSNSNASRSPYCVMVLVTEKDITFIAIQKPASSLACSTGNKIFYFQWEKTTGIKCWSFIAVDKKALTKSFHAYIVRTRNEISYPIKKDLRYEEKNPHEIFQISKNLQVVASISA